MTHDNITNVNAASLLALLTRRVPREKNDDGPDGKKLYILNIARTF